MKSNRNGIQTERAPLLLVFSDLAGRMAALVRARPSLIARLVVAPREAVHAIGAYLHLAPDAARSDAEVAASIEEVDPRDLLRAALPNCPARLYRALDRAGDRVHSRRFYERVGTICRGPFADALLEASQIDEGRLNHLEALSSMDPAVGTLSEVFRGDTYLAQSTDVLVAILRARGAFQDADLRLPHQARAPALARRLRAAMGRIEAPDPGFVAPPGFRFVRTTDELQSIGRAYGNCVALPEWNASRYHVNLIAGTVAFLVSDDPMILASLNRYADRVWQLEQVCSPKNEAAPPGRRTALIRDLRAAGLTIVSCDPQASLARLVQEGNRRQGAAADADLYDNDDDDEVAA